MKKIAVATVLFIATFGVSASVFQPSFIPELVQGVSEKIDPDGSAYPHWFQKGLYIGPATVNNPTTSTVNKITRTYEASATIDFASGTILCEDSAAITVVGAQTGDPCFVGIPTTLATTLLGRDHTYTCYVSAAGAVKVRACPAGTADNPASAVFRVRVFSSQ